MSAVRQMGVWVCAQISYKSVRRMLCPCGKVHDISQTACALVCVCPPVLFCPVFLDYISVCVCVCVYAAPSEPDKCFSVNCKKDVHTSR